MENITENRASQFISYASRNILILKSEDRTVRRNVLKEIQNKVCQCCTFFSEEDYCNLLTAIHKPLLLCLSDPVEKCREISASILNLLIKQVTNIDDFVPLTIGTLLMCLTSPDERECSEEVRLLEIQLLNSIVSCSEGKLLSQLNDITHILSKSILDPCPEIRRESCKCTVDVAYRFRTDFHMVSESLVNPLLKTLTHQHAKTRIVCIQALGSVVQFGNNKCVADVVSHLAQRLFDHSPIVRMAVVEVVGTWLVELPERYSFFHRLLPLLLSSLSDEVPDVRNRAKELWSKAGQFYLEENERDYKDQIDFPKPVLPDYPDKDGQPDLGCRVLVQKYLCNILPALLHDIDNWLVETRVKSAKLLYTLLLHVEEKATIKLQSFLDGICFSAKDEEEEAAETAIKTAELLGYFVDPKLWCDNLLSLVSDKPTASHLAILAAVIRGHGRKPLTECFTSICRALADPYVCRVRKPEEQANLLLSVEAVLMSSEQVDSKASHELFTALTAVSALTTNQAIADKARYLLETLSSVQSLSSITELYNAHLLALLKELAGNYELWTSHNPEVPIFSFLMESGCTVKGAAVFAIPMLVCNLQPGKDPKLRSQFLSLVAAMMQQLPLDANKDLSESIFTLVSDGLFPNLVWEAGHTAAALRTIAVANLWEVIRTKRFNNAMLIAVGEDMLPFLSSLADDDSKLNRLLACKILEQVIPTFVTSIDEHKIHNVCQEYLRCMDDECDDVRIAATRVFKAYFTSFPPEYVWSPYKAYLQHLYKNMLIHMDDKKAEIRMAVFDLLKEVAFASPEILITEAESVKFMMGASDLCSELIEHVKVLKICNKTEIESS